jgi:TonB family protein
MQCTLGPGQVVIQAALACWRCKVGESPIAPARQINDKGHLDTLFVLLPQIELLMPATQSQLDARSPSRLVIRIKLISQEQQPPPRRRISRSALVLILGAAAVLLSWLGISTLSTPDPPGATERPSSSGSESAQSLAVRSNDELVASEVTSSPEVEARSVESEVPQQLDAPTSTVNEAIPDVPRSALETIRGTVRVSVRVTVDKQGAVIDADADDRGPSRYFERLAVEAAKKWTFTPTNSQERRTVLVRFNFTRAGATAHASA